MEIGANMKLHWLAALETAASPLDPQPVILTLLTFRIPRDV